ncbi:MAG: glycosyl transferase family 2 [uncultured bacterium]|nr:MAG: glycosyl transferase family 2 [uncultured bacterium]
MGKVSKKLLTEASYLTGRYYLPPEYLSIILTYKCNFKCQMCNSWQFGDDNELSKKEWLQVVKDLNITLPKNTFVEISGGEPLIKKDLLFYLIKNLKEHFFKVTINSNGSLIDKTTIEEFEKLNLNCIKISLYSLDENIHNQLRGTSIAYANAIKAIQLISTSRIKLEIGILITSKNISDIPKLIEYLLQFDNISIILQPLDEIVYSPESKNIKKTVLPNNLWPDKKEVIKLFNDLDKNASKIKNTLSHLQAIKRYYLNPKSALSQRCFAGQRNLIISPNGDVSFCFKHKKVGNLKNNTLREILKNKAIDGRKEIKNCQKYCRILGCLYSRSFSEFFRDKIFIKLK